MKPTSPEWAAYLAACKVEVYPPRPVAEPGMGSTKKHRDALNAWRQGPLKEHHEKLNALREAAAAADIPAERAAAWSDMTPASREQLKSDIRLFAAMIESTEGDVVHFHRNCDPDNDGWTRMILRRINNTGIPKAMFKKRVHAAFKQLAREFAADQKRSLRFENRKPKTEYQLELEAFQLLVWFSNQPREWLIEWGFTMYLPEGDPDADTAAGELTWSDPMRHLNAMKPAGAVARD